MIRLDRLEGFYWVAKSQGYAKAARAFPYPISQPGVHQQVRKLETELGVQLFRREGKDIMRLTAEGEHFFAKVAPFLEALPELVSSLRSGRLGGVLRIRAAGLVLRHVMPDWVMRLSTLHPEIELDLGVLEDRDFDLLRRGAIDLFIDHFPRHPSDMESLKIGRTLVFLVLPRDHEHAARTRIPLQFLSETTFIGYPANTERGQIQRDFLRDQGFVPKRTISASTADAMLGLVESGVGFAMVPSFDAKGPRGKRLRVWPLRSPQAAFPIHAVWSRARKDHEALRAALAVVPRAD